MASIFMIRDGLLGAAQPERHVDLWRSSSPGVDALVRPFAGRPGRRRIYGLVQIAAGLVLAASLASSSNEGVEMLEHVPAWLGSLLHDRRAGHDKLVAADPDIRLEADIIELSSPAFAHGSRLPVRFTADGEGVSPPLVWANPPVGPAGFALIVEDPDAPALKPLVHAIVWDMPPDERRIAEGVIVADGGGGPDGDVGRNSFLREGWLPPDPPTGHGEHDYVFQLFALSERTHLDASPGRGAFIEAIAGRVLAAGVLIGTYSRGAPTNIRFVGEADGVVGELVAR